MIEGEREKNSLQTATLQAELSQRMLADTRTTLPLNPAVSALIALLFWAGAYDWRAAALVGCVGGASAVRYVLWRQAHGHFETKAVFRRLFWGAVLVGASWGAGAFLLARSPMGATAVGYTAMLYAGLVASAVTSLVAHPRTFHTFTALVMGGFLVAEALHGQPEVLLRVVLLVMVFWVVATMLHRRSLDELLTSLTTAARLRESEADAARKRQYLSALLQSVPHAVLILDESGRTFHVSAAFERVFGVREAEVVGLPLDELAGRSSALAALSEVVTRLAGGGSTEDVEIEAAGGERRVLHVAAERGGGVAEGTLVIAAEDVTTLRAAEEARREAVRQYREIVDSARDLVWRVDGEGRWTFLSETGALAIYGRSRDELLGRPLSEVTAPERVASDMAAFQQVMEGGELVDFETAHVRSDGGLIRLSFSAKPIRDAAGRFIGAEGTARDVTERAEHREALEKVVQQDALIRALLNSSPDLIFLKDSHGKYRGVNPALEKVFRRPESDVLGLSDTDLFPLDEALQHIETDRQAFAQRGPVTYDDWVTLPEGPRLFHVVKTPQIDPFGRPLGLIGIARDVTEFRDAQERAERLAREAEHANRMKSSFLANMSHEIRTPMNGVLGMTEILLDTPLTPEQRQAAETVQTSAESLLSLLNDILDLSKIEAGYLELEQVPFDVSAAAVQAARTLAPAASKSETDLAVDVGPDVPAAVRGDPMRLRQVLVNLIGNAVKFTERGEVVLGVALERETDQHAWLRFTVRDSGVGIPEDRLERIFEAFSQADLSITRTHGGTGLGLTISRQIVQHMGGTLEVRSQVGEGSEFWFVIPLAKAQATHAATGAGDEAPSLDGLRALIVDDNATNRRVLCRAMEHAGARTVDAADGLRALSLLRDAHLRDDPFHVVLLDDRLGEGRGVDVLAAMKSDPALAAIPTLLLSSAPQPGEMQRARALGVDVFLSKPVHGSDLVRAVWQLVRAGGGQADTTWSPVGVADDSPPVSLRILVAEDNAVNQQVAVALLKKRGHHVDIAADGREALHMARSAAYDLILMDVRMPHVDGLTATVQLRADPVTAELPIIALTAHAMPEERDRCLAAGMNDFLSKPFRPAELFAILERWAPVSSRRALAPELPTAATNGEARAVDLDGFRSAMREVGAESVVDQAVAIFVQDAPNRMDRVRAALTGGDAREIDSSAHAFRSGAGSIHAHHLATVLADIERHAEADDVAAAVALATALEGAYAAVMAQLGVVSSAA